MLVATHEELVAARADRLVAIAPDGRLAGVRLRRAAGRRAAHRRARLEMASGEALPVELAEALERAPGAAERWRELTERQRRDHTAHVGGAVREETRRRRAEKCVETLLRSARSGTRRGAPDARLAVAIRGTRPAGRSCAPDADGRRCDDVHVGLWRRDGGRRARPGRRRERRVALRARRPPRRGRRARLRRPLRPRPADRAAPGPASGRRGAARCAVPHLPRPQAAARRRGAGLVETALRDGRALVVSLGPDRRPRPAALRDGPAAGRGVAGRGRRRLTAPPVLADDALSTSRIPEGGRDSRLALVNRRRCSTTSALQERRGP